MGGGGEETTSTRTGSKSINAAVDTIGSQLDTNLGKGVTPFPKGMHAGLSNYTNQGIDTLMNASWNTGGLQQANNWARGVVGQDGYNDALRGAQSGVQNYLRESQADAPGYATMRENALNDAMAGVGSSFLTDGRFGSSVMGDAAGEAATGVLAGMDYQRHNDRLGAMLQGNQALAGIGQTAMGNAAGAASALPGFYQAGLMPGQTQLQIGQIKDADAQAKRQDEAAWFDRTNNQGWNTLERASGIINGTAGAAGQQTTSPTAPWWQQALGAGALGAGMFGSVAKGGASAGWWG